MPPGLVSGILFFAVVAIGAIYITVAKLNQAPAVLVTAVPVCIMILYACLLGFARLFRLRDDQSGDNLYYLGFLYTLTSLAVSLYQFRADEGAADQIVQNFGVAIASTIAGIALRIFFNQMRRDPIEIEQTARLELADASRRVKRELENTILEFGYFRRTTQQSIAEAVEEINTQLKDAGGRIVNQLDDFANTSSKPLEEASRKSGATIDHLNTQISEALEAALRRIADDIVQMSRSTRQVTQSFDSIATKMAALQTPDHIIEVKLSPMIQGLTRAVNNLGKNADAHAKMADANLKQTQKLVATLSRLTIDIRAEPEEPVASEDVAPPSEDAVIELGPHEQSA
jgi:hypothetical protein